MIVHELPKEPMTYDFSQNQQEIIRGLLSPSPHISSKYFYDAQGSIFFEEITRLPEYYLTRTEQAIMRRYASEIAKEIGFDKTIIELGAGNCEKAQYLSSILRPSQYVAVDISEEFLHSAVISLRAALPNIQVRTVVADLMNQLVMPSDLSPHNRLVFYPGSSIGNFDPDHALGLLSRIRNLIGEDGAFLIGIDLVKDTQTLEAAYNDAAGTTAAFNLNILSHINSLIGSDFVSSDWRHRAFFNSTLSRIEMHLEACRDTSVHWPGGGRIYMKGESIQTENSYKYQVNQFISLLNENDFHQVTYWTDEHNRFAVILARP